MWRIIVSTKPIARLSGRACEAFVLEDKWEYRKDVEAIVDDMAQVWVTRGGPLRFWEKNGDYIALPPSSVMAIRAIQEVESAK